MKYFLGILLLFITVGAFAQQQEKPLIQFSGIVYNADSAKVVVPYVTVTNSTAHNQVYVSNYKGYFSFVVHEQDTLIFTSIGFAPVMVFPVPDPASKGREFRTFERPGQLLFQFIPVGVAVNNIEGWTVPQANDKGMKACPEFRQQGDNRSTGFIFNIDQDKAVLLRVPDRETHGGKIYPQFTELRL